MGIGDLPTEEPIYGLSEDKIEKAIYGPFVSGAMEYLVAAVIYSYHRSSMPSRKFQVGEDIAYGVHSGGLIGLLEKKHFDVNVFVPKVGVGMSGIEEVLEQGITIGEEVNYSKIEDVEFTKVGKLPRPIRKQAGNLLIGLPL